jgi:SAM-dependent methyltransferase
MTTKIIHRETCRLCDSSNVKLVVKLEPIPVAENYSEDSETGKKADRYPVDLYMCADCGHVQQLDVIDSKTLWGSYTYYSGGARGITAHFKEVVAQIREIYQQPSGTLVIDIGSNDGSLLKEFKEAGYRVLGIDPAIEIARLANESGIETIPALMSKKLAISISKQHGEAQVVCAFNVFAHTDNLDEMTDSIRTLLAPDGLFFFEAQYLLDVIDKMLIATIFHEHMSHHSVKALVQFLDKHGLELINLDRVSIQDGSLLGTVQLKGGNRPVNESVQKLLDLEAERRLDKLETLHQFSERIKQLKRQTVALVQEWKKSNISIAGFGAARSGPTLISQLGLTDVIEYIVDDHPQKVNKYSSGDGIPIIPTSELLKRMPAYTIILASVHAEKIIQSNQEYLDKGGYFVVLYPQTRIVKQGGEVII